MHSGRTAGRALSTAGSALAILLAGMSCGLPLRAGEPAAAPANRGSLFAQSTVPAVRLDDPIDLEGNGQLTNGVLELRGPIDQAMRQRFEEAVATGNVTTIRITSLGGDIPQALQMAATIRARDINVVVRELCLGACAQYLFVAAHKRKLEPRSLVAFMNTLKSYGVILGMATQTLEVQNTIESAMDRLAAVEEDLYRQRGVAASLLVDPQLALQPSCVILRRNGTSMSWTMSSTYLMWVPSRQYLKAAGVEFEGDWPKSHFTLGGLVFHYMHGGDSRFVRFGDDDHLRSKKQKPYSLEEIRKCVLDELPPDSGTPPG
jgi:hypothetical protein